MQKQQQQQQQKFIKSKFNPSQPPQLCKPRRPIKGISLAFLLFFCGLLFMTHGFHRYEQYSVWDLIAVWTLSFMLLIPGIFFVGITFAAQFGLAKIKYQNYPQLYN